MIDRKEIWRDLRKPGSYLNLVNLPHSDQNGKKRGGGVFIFPFASPRTTTTTTTIKSINPSYIHTYIESHRDNRASFRLHTSSD